MIAVHGANIHFCNPVRHLTCSPSIAPSSERCLVPLELSWVWWSVLSRVHVAQNSTVRLELQKKEVVWMNHGNRNILNWDLQ